MEKDNERVLRIINEDKTTEEVEVIVEFRFKDPKDQFIVYTKNEKCGEGNVIVYISKVDLKESLPTLLNVSDEEYERVINALHEMIALN